MPEINIRDAREKAAATLRQRRETLISDFISDQPADFMEQNTRLLDDYFRESFEKSMVGPGMEIAKNPYAIIALGGYGRQEQCLHSDVDILFLFKKDVPPKAEALIREIVYPLWDIGMDVGHATRSLRDCIRLAGKDFEVLTSLLDARFICGMSLLYSELATQVREKIVFRKSNKIVEWMCKSNRKRHEYFGNSAYLLEPNLKEGPGGLRDYHSMHWLAQVRFNLNTPRDLEYEGYLSHGEYQDFMASLAFIRNARSGLHLLCRRKYDQLHFENQLRLADLFQYREQEEQPAVEIFLGELQGHMERIKQQHLIFFYEVGKSRKPFRLNYGKQRKTSAEGLEVRKEMLAFVSPEHILKNPLLLLKIFEESAVLQIPPGAEALRLVREFSYLADHFFRSGNEAPEILERILLLRSPKAFSVLASLYNTGLLTRLIPELKAVENRIEYNSYHIYPVDRHLLQTVQVIKSFGSSEDKSDDSLCAGIYHDLPDKNVLLWAALFHDIGKGVSEKTHAAAGAEIAEKRMPAMGYDKKIAGTVSFLVREHLLLFHTATRRDIEDQEILLHCARKIRDVRKLQMLWLLTVADHIATGPNAWNEWTAVLLRELFLKIMHILENGEFTDIVAGNLFADVQKKTQQILRNTDATEKTETGFLLTCMSPRYLNHTSLPDIREHIRMYRQLGEKNFIWKIRRNEESGHRSVTVCGKDIPGCFSKIAGIFAGNRIHILEARTYSWRNHTVLSIFQVTPPPDPIFEDERWARAEKELRAALAGKLDIMKTVGERIAGDDFSGSAARYIQNSVHVDNRTSRIFTIIEVFTKDSPGLLFRLTDALFHCRLDIRSAQISTKAEQAVDVFYVTDFDGRKIETPEYLSVIRAAIEKILPKKNIRNEIKKIAVS